jgi:hypothetical protein
MVITDNQITTLAELFYMNIDKGPIPWAKLDQAIKDGYRTKVKSFLEDLGRIGFVPRPATEVAQERKPRALDETLIRHVTDEILNGMPMKFKLFPAQEFSIRVVRELRGKL